MQETYQHLAVLNPVRYSYGEIEMILGQDVYHAIRPLDYFSTDEKCSPFAVRLPIGWVLSGPLRSSSSLVSTCFKANVEQDYESACQFKSWNDMELYGAFKQVDPRSAADARAQEILETTNFHNAKDTMPVCFGLMTTSSSRITIFHHWYSSSLSKGGFRETQH